MIFMAMVGLTIFETNVGSCKGILIAVIGFFNGNHACCVSGILIYVSILVINVVFIANLLMLLTFYGVLSCFPVILMFIFIDFICLTLKY